MMRSEGNEITSSSTQPPQFGAGGKRASPNYDEQRLAWQVHAAVFAVGMAIMFVVNLAINLAAGIAGHWSAWWSLWSLLGWSIGVAVHGLVVWLNRPAKVAP